MLNAVLYIHHVRTIRIRPEQIKDTAPWVKIILIDEHGDEFEVTAFATTGTAPPEIIIERISAVSITVTAKASTSVPKGSPMRCATTSAWWTATRRTGNSSAA